MRRELLAVLGVVAATLLVAWLVSRSHAKLIPPSPPSREADLLPRPGPCIDPVEVAGPQGLTGLACRPGATDAPSLPAQLDALTRRLGLAGCADRLLALTAKHPGPLFVRLGADCRAVELRPGRLTAATTLMLGLPMDLNRASAQDLQAIDGIGPALSRRIVSHRDANGPFCAIEELRRVKGVGPKTIEALRPHLTAHCEESF